MFLFVLIEPRYVDGENEGVYMRPRKACVASKQHRENNAKETMVDSQVHTSNND